jgi:hypothetical protein
MERTLLYGKVSFLGAIGKPLRWVGPEKGGLAPWQKLIGGRKKRRGDGASPRSHDYLAANHPVQ